MPVAASPAYSATVPPYVLAAFVVPPDSDNCPGKPAVDKPTTMDREPAELAPLPDMMLTPPPLNLYVTQTT